MFLMIMKQTSFPKIAKDIDLKKQQPAEILRRPSLEVKEQGNHFSVP